MLQNIPVWLNHKLFIPALAVLLVVTACEDGGENNTSQKKSLVTTLADTKDLSLFYTLAAKAEVSSKLSNPRLLYTVFAPSDEAIEAYLDANNINSINDLSSPEVENLVLNHIAESAYSINVLGNSTISNLANNELSFDVEDINTDEDADPIFEYTINKGVKVSEENILAPNGYIHVVDAVISFSETLPLLNQRLVAEGELSLIAEQFARPALAALLAELKNEEGSLTVFIPTNTAITNFLTANNLSSLNEVDDATLLSLLQNHIIAGTYAPADWIEGDYATLGSQQISITTNGGIQANGISTNATIEAANGFVYTIDEVL